MPRATPQFQRKTCRTCHAEFIPRSGRQERCQACRKAPRGRGKKPAAVKKRRAPAPVKTPEPPKRRKAADVDPAVAARLDEKIRARQTESFERFKREKAEEEGREYDPYAY